eukprot:c12431_g1_i2 orf=1092-1289(-)
MTVYIDVIVVAVQLCSCHTLENRLLKLIMALLIKADRKQTGTQKLVLRSGYSLPGSDLIYACMFW